MNRLESNGPKMLTAFCAAAATSVRSPSASAHRGRVVAGEDLDLERVRGGVLHLEDDPAGALARERERERDGRGAGVEDVGGGLGDRAVRDGVGQGDGSRVGHETPLVVGQEGHDAAADRPPPRRGSRPARRGRG
jgi:hypothetical protein